jgi:predicted ATPase
VFRAPELADDTTGRGPHAARLLDFLRDKRLLLVLDNFEHILAAIPQIAAWLSASANLQVLVTSRSALYVRGERLFPVSPLPVPPVASGSTIAGTAMLLDPVSLAEYPSDSLFVERAQAVDSAFKLTRANSQGVAEISARMEGMPLELELTAARSARLVPENVRARLERRPDIASGVANPRDLQRHQQTLHTSLDSPLVWQ